MQISRPVFLELWRIKLPITATVSILHRVSGVLMLLAIPGAAHLFHQALSGPQGFAATMAFLDTWPVKLALLVMLWSLLHHLAVGVRHLALDLGFGLDRPVARATAWISMIGTLVVLALVVVLGG